MFWDLTTLYEEGSSGDLHIIENEFLGKGGFGFVCKGELRQEVSYKSCMHAAAWMLLILIREILGHVCQECSLKDSLASKPSLARHTIKEASESLSHIPKRQPRIFPKMPPKSIREFYHLIYHHILLLPS